ncbi:MAG TPA: hypothetical protein VIT65_27625 [Microlunatus sp.]
MTDRPNDHHADDPDAEPEVRKPAVDEATPEQPVIQRAGTPLVDGGRGDGADRGGDTGTPDKAGPEAAR